MTLESETDAAAAVLRARRARPGRAPKGGSAIADPTAREFLRRADQVLRELIGPLRESRRMQQVRAPLAGHNLIRLP